MCDQVALCYEFLDPDVVAWAEGRSQIMPRFTDHIQLQAAAAQRRILMWETELNRCTAALRDFPEWTWGVGLTHDRPQFADARSFEIASARRQQLLESLLRRGEFEALTEFPEWHAVASSLNIRVGRDLSATLKSVAMPRLPKSRSRRRLYRRFTGQWGGKLKGCYQYVLFLLQEQVTLGHASAKPAKSRSQQREHSFVIGDFRTRKVSEDWRKPALPKLDQLVVDWAEGRYHGPMPPLRDYRIVGNRTRGDSSAQIRKLEKKRRASFMSAVRQCHPAIDAWPEFGVELRKLGLSRLYHHAGTLSSGVVCVFITRKVRKYGRFEELGQRMSRKGKDPMQLPGYRRAQQQFFEALAESMRIQKQYSFLARQRLAAKRA